ncbi:bifunctional diguanylate cyclase/phosphodiesterase [Treponema zioleckii]|uniref:bifunctional diguanylate cyclase/phosphodiesterase n=1 Tax=Treponema zioleckii TaxID=331680 RepID=UPI00168B3A4A|nr:GGDEF and EAL domain-containing protein [Treponema zioleckii]
MKVYSQDISLNQLESVLTVLNNCTDSFVFFHNLTKSTFFISDFACNFFDLPGNKFSNSIDELLKVTYKEDQAIMMAEFDSLKLGRKKDHNIEFRWVNKNGKPVWLSCRSQLISDNDEKTLVGFLTITDSQDKSDLLTGLPTDTQFRKDFGDKHSQQLKVSGFMLKIDIDNLGLINEQHGIATGNLVIQKVAECCRKVCSTMDSRSYRISGDEFICMNLDGSSAVTAQKMFENLKREIAEVEKTMEADIVFTISAGIVAFSNDLSQLDEFLKKLNYTVSVAKETGRNKLVMFNAADYNSHLRKLDLQEKIRDSIRKGFEGFELYYQPVVDARKPYLDSDCSIPNVIGAEALLRWTHPKYGLLYPDEFIPILEKTGMIISVGRWILKNAFSQCHDWNRIQKDFHMSVNISYIQVQKSDILSDVETALLTSKVSPANITVELTESGYIDNVEALQKLTEAFSGMGLNVDIDDFGTGYSNLRYLQYLHATTLKLDYTFVHHATHGNEGDNHVIKHITQMAHELGMKVCMEGIESKNDIEKLIVFEPDKFQGFYFGRPENSKNFKKNFIVSDLKKESLLKKNDSIQEL